MEFQQIDQDQKRIEGLNDSNSMGDGIAMIHQAGEGPKVLWPDG
jgi:hypothetical protein